MFTQFVTTLKRLVECLFTAPSSATTETRNNSVSPSPVQSGQPCKAAPTPRSPRKSSPAPTQRKPKQEVAPSTTVAAKRGKKKSTAQAVATERQSKPTGSKSKTAASKTRRHAK